MTIAHGALQYCSTIQITHFIRFCVRLGLVVSVPKFAESGRPTPCDERGMVVRRCQNRRRLPRGDTGGTPSGHSVDKLRSHCGLCTHSCDSEKVELFCLRANSIRTRISACNEVHSANLPAAFPHEVGDAWGFWRRLRGELGDERWQHVVLIVSHSQPAVTTETPRPQLSGDIDGSRVVSTAGKLLNEDARQRLDRQEAFVARVRPLARLFQRFVLRTVP